MDINLAPLSTSQIEQCMRRKSVMKKTFRGCFAADTLPNEIDLPAAFIANTDTRDKPGKHWVAFYVDKNRVCDFFDSFGSEPQIAQHIAFLKKNCVKVRSNLKRLQSSESSLCGHYCCLFLTCRQRGLTLKGFVGGAYTSNSYNNDARTALAFGKVFNWSLNGNNAMSTGMKCCSRKACLM
jgi:Adenovirus endoprotease